MEEEIWKVIEGFDYPYEISNMGRVKFPKRKTIRKNMYSEKEAILNERIALGSPNSCGYLAVSLQQDNKFRSIRIHKLVAEYFVENPNGYNEVDHIDRNRRNNKATNLRWCNHSVNCLNRDMKKLQRAVVCIETGEKYISAAEATKKLGLRRCAVRDAANPKHKQQTAGGYHWKFLE